MYRLVYSQSFKNSFKVQLNFLFSFRIFVVLVLVHCRAFGQLSKVLWNFVFSSRETLFLKHTLTYSPVERGMERTILPQLNCEKIWKSLYDFPHLLTIIALIISLEIWQSHNVWRKSL